MPTIHDNRNGYLVREHHDDLLVIGRVPVDLAPYGEDLGHVHVPSGLEFDLVYLDKARELVDCREVPKPCAHGHVGTRRHRPSQGRLHGPAIATPQAEKGTQRRVARADRRENQIGRAHV